MALHVHPYLDLEVRIKRPWWRRRRVLPCQIVGLHSAPHQLTVTIETRLLVTDLPEPKR